MRIVLMASRTATQRCIRSPHPTSSSYCQLRPTPLASIDCGRLSTLPTTAAQNPPSQGSHQEQGPGRLWNDDQDTVAGECLDIPCQPQGAQVRQQQVSAPQTGGAVVGACIEAARS